MCRTTRPLFAPNHDVGPSLPVGDIYKSPPEVRPPILSSSFNWRRTPRILLRFLQPTNNCTAPSHPYSEPRVDERAGLWRRGLAMGRGTAQYSSTKLVVLKACQPKYYSIPPPLPSDPSRACSEHPPRHFKSVLRLFSYNRNLVSDQCLGGIGRVLSPNRKNLRK
jgi:hypothetical protein